MWEVHVTMTFIRRTHIKQIQYTYNTLHTKCSYILIRYDQVAQSSFTLLSKLTIKKKWKVIT